MSDFTESSQLKEWMFESNEILLKCRAQANLNAREYLSKPKDDESSSNALPPVYNFACGYTNKEEAKNGDDPTTQGPWKTPSEHDFLTPDEEELLVAFYTSKIPSLIGPLAQVPRLRRESKVTATATMFLRRFFLSNSVMIHDPKNVMVAACFLATKVEDVTADVRYLEDGTQLMNAPVTMAS